MKKDVKRTIYLILIAIILFSAAMAVPALYNSKWREAIQGGAAGLFIAACLGIVKIIVLYRKSKK
jgi:hypothetical protein